MSTAVVAAGAADGAAKQPPAGVSGDNVAGAGKPWWRNTFVVVWLLSVYLFCLMQAINTMVALNAQQEISAIVAQNDTGSPGSGGNDENGGNDKNATSGKSSAKTQLATAIRLRDQLRVIPSGDDQKRNALEEKFSALPPEIQQAAIEAEAGYYTGKSKVDIGYVLMPMAMVTLMMSLWMGALGGAIHMTVEFLRKDEAKSGAWYFFRPFHGAVLALAVFIIFQAGQIVLTNPKPQGNAGLNPYVIAFVAIVSGMLTDQAYRRIGLAGSQFLGAKADEKPRWARPGVVQDKRAGRPAADLARYMPGGTLVATCEAWLDGSKELSESEQAVLAAWLHAEPRDLFTDQPPAPTENGSTTDPQRGATPPQPEEAGSGSGEASEGPEGSADPGADQQRSGTPALEPEKRAA